ncbi:hypothetical protein M440DRAFT_1461781 [Trichoderma longibrachiatum ATCC 18648]|uniref:Secreted protein n=1 Tax=Trichoderma longibrachiatum ATCC 18648 TaxID=983965 RepID=A0A2T4CB03_TRILO|nr:hypothetical protein M440DRAFT_1461781 [Trichoderma longibrachiatum ATCC 18648]
MRTLAWQLVIACTSTGVPDAAWAGLMVSGPTLKLHFRAGGLGPLVHKSYRAETSRDSVLSDCRPLTRTFELGAEPTTEQGTDQEERPAPTGSELTDGGEMVSRRVPALWGFGALRGRQKPGKPSAGESRSLSRLATGWRSVAIKALMQTRDMTCAFRRGCPQAVLVVRYQQLDPEVKKTQQQQDHGEKQSDCAAH